jgi:peptidoglycan/LPS O-acetylase OafA/YrhL
MGGYAAIAILAVFPVAHCATGGPSRFTRLLSSRPLVWIGRRSYGIYLFHLPIIEALEPLGRGRPGAPYVAAVSSAVATLVLAWASYRFVESRWIVTGRPAVTTPPGPIAM